MAGSALCSFYLKNKIAKCLRVESKIFEQCVQSGASGVPSRDNHSSSGSYPSSSTMHSVAQQHSGTYAAPNGDVYNNGKLTAFVGSNGTKHSVRRPGPR